jgi:hypothetical protein
MIKNTGERTNEYKQHPEIVERLTKLLEKYVAEGRSTSGVAQQNDLTVNIRKAKPLSVDDEGKAVTHD